MIRYVEDTILSVLMRLDYKRAAGAIFGFVLGAISGATAGTGAIPKENGGRPQSKWVGIKYMVIGAAIGSILFAVTGWFAGPRCFPDEDIDELGWVAPEAEEKKEIRAPLVASYNVRSSELSSSDTEEKLPRSTNRQYPKTDVTAKLSSIIITLKPE